MPDEPTEVKADTRTLLEDSSEEGGRVIADAAFVSDLLWEQWGTDLEAAGIGYGRFLEISRSYAGEFRLPARQDTILAEVNR